MFSFKTIYLYRSIFTQFFIQQRISIHHMGVHMLFPNTLAIHGCGIVYVLVVELMEVSVILILTRVSCIIFNLGHNYSKSLIFTYCECSFNIDNIKVNKFIVHVN